MGTVKNPTVRRIEARIPLSNLLVKFTGRKYWQISLSYLLAVRRVIVTPILSCKVAFKFHIVGSGVKSKNRSVMMFGIDA